MAKISVVIPMYNVEDYLRECLDNIIGQTLKDIEIICVNDGSTDRSSEILEEYTKKDNRIKVIHKENSGLVSARKTGVSLAKGKYIGYVDSDDWIEPEMYMELYTLAEKYDVDFVSSGYFLEGNYTTTHVDTIEEGIYNQESFYEFLNQVIYQLNKKETGLRASLCCKLFFGIKVMLGS